MVVYCHARSVPPADGLTGRYNQRGLCVERDLGAALHISKGDWRGLFVMTE